MNAITEYLLIFFGAMIPFIEFLLTIPVAIILFDLNPIIATLVATAGNILSLTLFIVLGEKLTSFLARFQRGKEKGPSKRSETLRKYYDKFGAVGLSFFGSFLLSSQLTAAGMVPLGTSRRKAFVWTSLAVVIYAITIALLSFFAENWIEDWLNL